MPLLTLFLIIVACGVLAALVRAAPDNVIAEPFKSILVWLLLAVAVVAILYCFATLLGLAPRYRLIG